MAKFIFGRRTKVIKKFDGEDISQAFYYFKEKFNLPENAKCLVNGISERRVSQNYIIQPNDLIEFLDEAVEEA
jgi:hypothetical protein